jgi:hypothetical protein
MTMFVKLFLAAITATALAYGQSEVALAQKNQFPYSLKECPDFSLIAKSHWIPEALLDFKEKLVKCEHFTKTLTIGEKRSITLIQYLYHFREDTNYISKQQFNFIVENSTNAILWDRWTSEYPHGAIEDIQLITLNQHPIIQLELFTGGTAGYWEEYFLYSNGEFSRVGSTFEESAKGLIPKGYSIRRIRADVKALTAVVYLATETDANCCPSGRLDLKLAYRNNDLILLSGRFAKN